MVLGNELFDDGHDVIGASVAVEVPGGLVAEKEGGVGNDGAGNGDPLLLATRELPGKMVHAVGETHDAESGFHMRAAFRLESFVRRRGNSTF